MKLTMKEWLEKEVQKGETKRTILDYNRDRDTWNEFIAVGGKLTAFKQVLDWIEKHE